MSDLRVENGIPNFAVICPQCHANMDRNENGEFRIADFHSDTISSFDMFDSYEEVEEFWHCEHCDWSQDVDAKDYTNKVSTLLMNEQANLHSRLNRAVDAYEIGVADLNDMDLPQEDFDWSDMEAGDWHVYCCGDKDCPRQWHKVAYSEQFSRKDGVLTITRESVDEDGNWDHDDEWKSDEGTRFEDSDMARSWNTGMRDYFKGWAEYWLSCASSLSDPVEDAHKGPEADTPESWVKFCLKAAEDNIKSLEGTS